MYFTYTKNCPNVVKLLILYIITVMLQLREIETWQM
jgi:hypothetical protein